MDEKRPLVGSEGLKDDSSSQSESAEGAPNANMSDLIEEDGTSSSAIIDLHFLPLSGVLRLANAVIAL